MPALPNQEEEEHRAPCAPRPHGTRPETPSPPGAASEASFNAFPAGEFHGVVHFTCKTSFNC